MSQKIVVACKLPNGLDLGPGPDGKRVVLNGTHHSSNTGGFGLTTGVDKDFFDKWASDHKGFPPLEKGFIFSHESHDYAAAQAAEMAAVRNGLEGLDPDKPGPGLERVPGTTPDQTEPTPVPQARTKN